MIRELIAMGDERRPEESMHTWTGVLLQMVIESYKEIEEEEGADA